MESLKEMELAIAISDMELRIDDIKKEAELILNKEGISFVEKAVKIQDLMDEMYKIGMEVYEGKKELNSMEGGK